MIKKREPYLYIVAAAMGQGKTHITKQDVINNYVKGDLARGIPPKPVLILDTVGDPLYQKYKRIAIEDVRRFSVHPRPEVRRINIYKNVNGKSVLMNGQEIYKMIVYVLENFYNGLLVLEDFARVVGDALGNDIVGYIYTLRHRNSDIIIHFQGLGKCGHPKLLQTLSIMRLHKVTDGVDRHKNKFEEIYSQLKIAENIINTDFRNANNLKLELKSKLNSYSLESAASFLNIEGLKINLLGVFSPQDLTYKSGYVYYNHLIGKVSGKFTEKQFDDAIDEYITQNEKTELYPFINKKDSKGNKIYTYETALKACRKNLKNEYCGNNF